MKIIKNQDACWTENRINHIKKYRKAYFDDGCGPSDEYLNYQIEKIKKGEKTDKIINSEMFCYEIFNDNDEHVGDVTLSIQPSSKIEISVSVFVNYSNNGYGVEAIKRVCKEIHLKNHNDIIAKVRQSNEDKGKIELILNKCGFKEEQCEYWILSKYSSIK